MHTGKARKSMVSEMSRLIELWCDRGLDYLYALKQPMVMPGLILQRTTEKCKSHEVRKKLGWKNCCMVIVHYSEYKFLGNFQMNTALEWESVGRIHRTGEEYLYSTACS